MKKLLFLLFAATNIAFAQQIHHDSICTYLTAPTWELRRQTVSGAPAHDTVCVGIYIKTDYQTWLAFGNENSIRTFVANAFAQTFKIYEHDGALLYIDSIGFSKDSDNFNQQNSVYNLLAFAAECDSIKPTADLYSLWSFSSYNLGGVAYVGTIGSSPYYRTSYCNIYQSFNLYPVYSWTPEVTAHEWGHLCGLQHTHCCCNTRLDGTTGPLDTCYTPEGGCYVGPNIPRVGKIMSYCHLSWGIDFLLGFGAEQKIQLRDNLYNARVNGYLKSPYYYYIPVNMQKSNVTASSANITWESRKQSFKLYYRPKGSTTWTIVTVTNSHTYTLTALASTTIYQVKVKGLNTPVFGKIIQFKTL